MIHRGTLRQVLPVASFAALVIYALLEAPPARADVVHLRTGEVVKAELLERRSTPEVLVVKDLVKEAVRELAWSAVEPGDRDRLMADWLLRGPAVAPVKGEVIRHEIDTGVYLEVRGVVEDADAKRLRVRSFGEVIEIARPKLGGREPAMLDPREVYAPDVLVERYAALLLEQAGASRLARLPLRTAMRTAEYALRVGAYGRAAELFGEALADPTFPEHAAARAGRDRARARKADETLLKDLRHARRDVALGRFSEARGALTGIRQRIQQAGDLVRRDDASARQALERARKYWLPRAASARLPAILEARIREKVADRDLTLGDAAAWTRRELADLGFSRLATALQEHDDTVTATEAQAAWQKRPPGAWREVSYGSGTFIVRPSKQPGAHLPTRDRWWKQASQEVRASWLRAYSVENSGLFQVEVREVDAELVVRYR